MRKRFCNMFSESCTGSWAELNIPCYPCKQGKLPENMLRNLFLNLPPQTVQGTSIYTYKPFSPSGVLTRSKKTEHALVGGSLIVALAEQVEDAVVQWRPDEELYSHLGIEVEVCELKRYEELGIVVNMFMCLLHCLLHFYLASDSRKMATRSHSFRGMAPILPP